MAQVITFEDYTPTPRYDGNPWTNVQVEEGATVDGPWVLIDTLAISPVDSDPENPATRSFTTELASDTDGLWYRLIFIDGSGDDSLPTAAVQNALDGIVPYATVTELARILKIRTPSDEQTIAMRRCLVSAAVEINAEIDLGADTDLSGAQLRLCEEVNLQRAAELWKLEEVQFGIVGLGSEFGATHMARNTWDKYAFTLAPLKDQWGLA
jgi:hypothetical protein